MERPKTQIEFILLFILSLGNIPEPCAGCQANDEPDGYVPGPTELTAQVKAK